MAADSLSEDQPQVTTTFSSLDITKSRSYQNIAKQIAHIEGDGGYIQAIGIVSYELHQSKRLKSILKREHANITVRFKCNWLVKLHATKNKSHAQEARENAIRYIRRRHRYTPCKHSDVKRGTSNMEHCVYAIVHRDVTYGTDFSEPQDLISCINEYLEDNDDPRFYIGITSGTGPIDAMIRRRTGDQYKNCHGVNSMIAIYKTRNQKVCCDIERMLIREFSSEPNNLNRTGGGGGNHTTQPWSYVYLGMCVEEED